MHNFCIHSMAAYRCYVNGTKVGTVSASDSSEAQQKAKDRFCEDAEPECNARN